MNCITIIGTHSLQIVEDVKQQVLTEGCAILHASKVDWSGLDLGKIARGIVHLQQHGCGLLTQCEAPFRKKKLPTGVLRKQ